MNKLEQLFIRACKARNDEVRVYSVYRRFYVAEPGYWAIIPILANIVDKYKLTSIEKTMEAMASCNAWKYETKACPDDPRLGYLMGLIRFSAVDRFPGLVSPLRFRSLA